MKLYRHYSNTDSGANCVLAQVALQPECVLGVLLTPGGSDYGDSVYDGFYDTLKEFADENAKELTKYQCAIIVSRNMGNVFDIQLTLCYYRYPESYLADLVKHISDVPTYYSHRVPGQVDVVTTSHNTDASVVEASVLGARHDEYYVDAGLTEAIEAIIKRGCQLLARTKQS